MRVGISVHEGELRAVAVRAGRVVWMRVEALGQQSLGDALIRVYAVMPRPRFASTRVRLVLGPLVAQQRILNGLPPALGQRRVRQAVEENVDRFFLRSSPRVIVTDPVFTTDGELLAAAIDASVVAAATNACRATGIIPEYIACSAAVLPFALVVPPDVKVMEWGIGPERVCAYLRSGRVASVQRVAHGSRELGPAAVPCRAELNESGAAFAEAYGAAVANMRFLPALRRADLQLATRTPALLLRAASIMALIVALSAWLFAPALVVGRAAERAQERMNDRAMEQRRILQSVGAARRAAATVTRIEEFRQERRSMVALLGRISNALPDSTAVTTLRVDSLGGTLTLLAPHVMDAIPALAVIPTLDGFQVASPLTRETVAQKELERVSLRFHFRRAAPSAHQPRNPVALRSAPSPKAS